MAICGFLLENSLPGTWRGVHGSISYRVTAYVLQSGGVEHKFLQPVRIDARRDLSLEPRLRTPACSDASRRFRNALVSLGGRVRVTVWLPICGVVPGQGIPVLCRIINDSKIVITGLLFVLTKIETYRCSQPIKNVLHKRIDVCRVARTVDVDRGRYVYFCIVGTPNDLTCTSESVACQTCQVKYELWVSAQSGLPRNSAYGYPNIDTPGIPIIVGTKPLETWNINGMLEEIQEYIRRSNDDDFKPENSIRYSSEMEALT